MCIDFEEFVEDVKECLTTVGDEGICNWKWSHLVLEVLRMEASGGQKRYLVMNKK